MKRLILIFLFIAIVADAAFAASFNVVNPPGRVAVGQKFSITYRLKNGEGSSLKVPQINGCKLLYGPSTSTSQSYQIINGSMSSSSTVDYTYIYRAEKEGSYNVGEASIIVDGKKLTSKSFSITVVPGNPAQQSGGSKSGGRPQVEFDDASTQTADRSVSANDVFVRIILSKPTAYEQEAIECTMKLYTKYTISSFMPTKMPSYDGFLIEEMNVQPSLNEVETYNGQRYMTAVLKKCIIFPQKSGKLTINSGNYDINVVQYDNVNMGFFTVQSPQERSIKVSSNSVSVNVLPLPQPQPDGFSGAVGKFTVESRLIGNSFRTNDPATLIYTISGTGNIKYLQEPKIDFPSEFEQYSPKSDIQASVSGNNVTGKMTIEYTFVPQSVGEFRIGGDKFVYFNPSTKEYVTIDTQGYNIKVAKGLSVASDVEQQDIELKNTDIRHIKLGDKKPSHIHSFVISQWWYWGLYAAIIAALVSVIAVNRRNIKRMADVKGMKLAKANKEAKKRLKLAKMYMDKKQDDKFYDEILRAVWGYLSDKLGIPVSQLLRDNVASELSKFGASEELCNKFIAVLDDCEMARYATASSQPSSVYAQATSAINELENTAKSSKR